MLNWKSHLGEWGSKILVGYGTHVSVYDHAHEVFRNTFYVFAHCSATCSINVQAFTEFALGRLAGNRIIDSMIHKLLTLFNQ